jgi:hypothetical protein
MKFHRVQLWPSNAPTERDGVVGMLKLEWGEKEFRSCELNRDELYEIIQQAASVLRATALSAQ